MKKPITFLILALILLPLTLCLLSSPARAVSVTLAWDASQGATGYKLYYGTATKTYPTIIDVKNVLTYTIPNLPDGATYYFAATAYDASSESDYSTEVSYAVPALVQNVRGAVVATTQKAGFFVTWDNTGAAGYKIKYGTVKGVYPAIIDAKTTNPYLIAGLANATAYYLVVTAYDASGKETANSNELTFKTLTVNGLVVR